MDWRESIGSKRDWLFSSRLSEMETGKRSLLLSILYFFIHRLYRCARAHKACPLSIDLSPCMRSCRVKHSRGFDQKSFGISDRSVVRSEMVDADRTESSERSWTLPVGSKASFPFRLSACEVRENGPSIHVPWGIRVRQKPKVLRFRSSFGRAGEPTMALKWGGRTDRARNKALWTH